MPVINKHLYSVTEACDLVSIGSTALYNEIREGKLIAKKFGKRTLITASSLEDWIQALPHKENVGGGNVSE